MLTVWNGLGITQSRRDRFIRGLRPEPLGRARAERGLRARARPGQIPQSLRPSGNDRSCGRDGGNLSPEPCEVDARRAWIPQAVPAGARASLVQRCWTAARMALSYCRASASRRRSICQARFLKAYARVGIIGVAAEMAGISLVGLEKSGRLGTRSGPSESSPVWRPRTIGRLKNFICRILHILCARAGE